MPDDFFGNTNALCTCGHTYGKHSFIGVVGEAGSCMITINDETNRLIRCKCGIFRRPTEPSVQHIPLLPVNAPYPRFKYKPRS